MSIYMYMRFVYLLVVLWKKSVSESGTRVLDWEGGWQPVTAVQAMFRHKKLYLENTLYSHQYYYSYTLRPGYQNKCDLL